MAEYAKRDQKIDQLRCELNHRKELLAGKLGKLSEASKVNSMLEGVVEDYKKHTQQLFLFRPDSQIQLLLLIQNDLIMLFFS